MHKFSTIQTHFLHTFVNLKYLDRFLDHFVEVKGNESAMRLRETVA